MESLLSLRGYFLAKNVCFLAQIALAIGVLTSGVRARKFFGFVFGLSGKGGKSMISFPRYLGSTLVFFFKSQLYQLF